MNEEILSVENIQEIMSETLENEEVSMENVSDSEHSDLPDSGDTLLSDEEMSADPDEEQSDSDSSAVSSETEEMFASNFALVDSSDNNLWNENYTFDGKSGVITGTINGLDPNLTYVFSCDVRVFAFTSDSNVTYMRLRSGAKIIDPSFVTSQDLLSSVGGVFRKTFTGASSIMFSFNPSDGCGDVYNILLTTYSENVEEPEVVVGTLFDTPLVNYSVSEGLLLCILFVLLAQFIHSIFKGSHWFGKL